MSAWRSTSGIAFVMRAIASVVTATDAAMSSSAAGREGSSASTSAPRSAAGLDDEAVLAVEDLRQREVVAAARTRAGVHRGAEAASRPASRS